MAGVSIMNLRILAFAIFCLGALACLGLAVSNPTHLHYRQSVLASMAEQEVNRQEQNERHAIEREAASIDS
jgi:hypothetical protein